MTELDITNCDLNPTTPAAKAEERWRYEGLTLAGASA